jgi:hypothetical protein
LFVKGGPALHDLVEDRASSRREGRTLCLDQLRDNLFARRG